MPDSTYNDRDYSTTYNKTKEVTGHYKSSDKRPKPFYRCTKSYKTPLQSIAKHNQAHAQKKRPTVKQNTKHDKFPLK